MDSRGKVFRGAGVAAAIRLWDRRSAEISVIGLVALALVVMVPRMFGPVEWRTDALFYQAQVYELRGQSQTEALQDAFTGPIGLSVTRAGISNPTWLNFAAPFYRRRWVVPAMAAALFPFAGANRSLLDASILGYVVLGPLLYALLRRRFSCGASLIVAATCLLLPPVREWSSHPMTDSWGLAMEVASLLAAVLALERGARWIGVWVASMLVLSFTRDSTVVVLGAVGWAAIVSRNRRSMAVLATGSAVSLPAFMLFGAPLVKQLAYAINGFHVPHQPTLSYVGSHYPTTLWSVLGDDAVYPGTLGHPIAWWLAWAAIMGTLGYCLIAASRRDVFFMLVRGAFVGAVATVALADSYTGMRLELVFVPCVAIALAFTLQRLRVAGSRLRVSRRITADAAMARAGGYK
jgi:hypothetical protein